MNHFDKLIDDLAVLAKAQADMDGDEKIAAAAGDDADSGDGMDNEDDTIEDDAATDGQDNNDAPMAKSLVVKLEGGKEMEVVDGTEMVKSLEARLEGAEETMAKAMGSAIELLTKQGEMIKSLTEKVAKLGGEGRGRKTVVSIVGRETAMTKSQEAAETAAPTGEQFMAKALEAQQAGRLSGQDVALAEGYLNKGLPVPKHIIDRVG